MKCLANRPVVADRQNRSSIRRRLIAIDCTQQCEQQLQQQPFPVMSRASLLSLSGSSGSSLYLSSITSCAEEWQAVRRTCLLLVGQWWQAFPSRACTGNDKLIFPGKLIIHQCCWCSWYSTYYGTIISRDIDTQAKLPPSMYVLAAMVVISGRQCTAANMLTHGRKLCWKECFLTNRYTAYSRSSILLISIDCLCALTSSCSVVQSRRHHRVVPSVCAHVSLCVS